MTTAAPDSPALSPSAVSAGPGATISVIRNDDWANPGTGMGVPGVDNRTGWMPYVRARNQPHLRQLWGGDGLAGRIVELPADEMTREGGDVNLGDGEGYDEAERLLRAHLDEANVWGKMALAKKFERAYGGGALIMAVDDGMPWDQPVDVQRIQSVRGLIHATPDELTAERYYDNPERGETYGKPAIYRWQPAYLPFRGAGGLRMVHESRVIAFTGLPVDNERMVQNLGWGDSVLGRCEERLRDTASALAGVGVALQNFSQDVLQLLGLGATLKEKGGIQSVNNRVATMRQHKSMIGALLIDKDEQYTRQGIPMTGVADALTQFSNFLSATTGIPVPILMGYSSVGLGDTGATQVRTFHRWVEAEQANSLRPAFNKYLRLLLRSRQGPTGGVEPPKWSIVFAPLERPTPAEEDQRRKNQADIDEKYIGLQVYGPGAVAKSRFKGPTGFSTSTEVDASPWEPLPGMDPLEAPPLAEGPEGAAVEPAAAEAQSPVQPITTEAESAQDTALNGAQVKSAQELVTSVAERKLPRSSGVAMLVRFFNLTLEAAEQVMGDVGRSFFIAPEDGALSTAPARADAADVYVGLLALDVGEKRAQRELSRVAGLPEAEAAARLDAIRRARLDAAGVTSFPRPGANKAVGLKASRWAVFDPGYAQSLKEDWPELWASGGNLIGNTQFDRLLPLARAGEAADTAVEEHAVRLREAWANVNGTRRTPKALVAMVKQLVVGTMGEAAMKRVLEVEKDKVRRRRAAGG